jgi:capsular polysaccharide biosynthesis protein
MELELKEYFTIIRKRLWLITSFVLIACLTTGLISYYLISPIYEANTKIIVNKSSQYNDVNILDLNAVNTNIMLVNTYKEIIKTPAIMDKVITQHPEFGITSIKLAGIIKVTATNDTQVMTISVEDTSATEAVNLVNAVTDVFKTEIPSIMKVDNVTILNEAKLEEKPVPIKPNKKMNIMISFIVSLMISLGIVFLLEYLDDTLKTEKDVEQYLGLSTLGTISKIKKEDIQLDTSVDKKRMMGETTYASSVNQ